ncbi:Uncharacterized protein OBRU01_26325 [Operophtera brumata]|uniref:MADF domain-containing protein n=1 Tax=Operophtera brumata TaxID=104452 RepID=A0A0L7K429_OPEBR|nr:Uncharacterized protein OBRU01_26325 [Operophtera brumata]
MDSKPQFIKSFIELYRSFPCLWKVKDDSYHNRRLNQTTVPSATIDTVKRKINNLKSSFRKELKKVKNQKSGSSADEVYTSSLWYFDLLMFTEDQETPRNSIGSDSIIDENETNENETFYEDDTQIPSPSTTNSSSQLLLPPNSPQPSDITIQSRQSTPTVQSKSSSANKRKSVLLNKAYKDLKEDDDYDGIELNVACKLRRMHEEQRLYAELLINKVLLYGMKQRLQEETSLSGLVPTQSQITRSPHLTQQVASTSTGTILQRQPMSQSILQLSPVGVGTSETIMINENEYNVREDINDLS